MKKISVGLVFCLLAGISVVALSQSKNTWQAPGIRVSSSIVWNQQTANVGLAGDQLRVKFDAAFASARWRVGAHVAEAQTATVSIALLSLPSKSDKPPLGQIQSVVNWPQEIVRSEAGIIEYRGAPETDDIAVHITLPAKARLQIEAGGKVLVTSTISRDVLIDKNGVSEKSMTDMANLIALTGRK
jgi:hypothetical protein